MFVGALGLTTTLTLGVVQRTREIGVMSAIGATPATLAGHVWVEAVAIAGRQRSVAALVIPVSFALEAACGLIFIKVPLDFAMSPGASVLWLVLVVGLASLSSLYPAWRATRITVQEALNDG